MERFLIALLLVLAWWASLPTEREAALVAGARACLGDVYDARRYPGGPPPRGRGACTDVVWRACLPVVDLQQAVGGDRELAYRWCPTLLGWFERNALAVSDWRPGDVVFWKDQFGVAYHCGVVSDRRGWDGWLLVIHNNGPVCTEDNRLSPGDVGGHFRLR